MKPFMNAFLALYCAGVSAHAEELEVVTVKVPTQLVVETYKARVDVGTREFQPIRLEARPNLTRGTLVEMNLRIGDKLRSDGMSVKSGINEVAPFATVLTRGLNGVPNTGEAFAYEYTISFFETEEPPGRMWSTKRGKGYKVLWTKTLQREVK